MSTRGRQAAVQEGSLLQLLRSVGYKEELPPSTVAWLDTAPVFRLLASKLSKENFVSPKDQQEYNEIMMARCPNADLYDALGSGSDEEDDAMQEFKQVADDDADWVGAMSDASVQQKVEAKEQEVQHLEQQIASLKTITDQLDASTSAQRSKQRMYMALQAQANQQLAAARAEAAKLNSELNELLLQLGQVCSELSDLAQKQPEQWLMCAADLSSYAEQDAVARQLFDRAMRLLSVTGMVRQLDAAATPAAANTPAGSPNWKQQQPQLGASPHKAAAAAAAADAPPAQFPTALIHTPSWQADKQQHQQQLPMLTPRGRGRSNREAELLDADIKRHTDQEARNVALLRELTRQRLAFKLALDNLLKAEVQEAGVKAQLAAAHDVKQGTGGFARFKKEGPSSVAQLAHDVEQLEKARQLLGSELLPALTEDLARLNDTYIVAGDYDRQLHKMAVAAQRKQAVLGKMLDVTSRHLLLLLLGSQERSRLAALATELEGTKAQLEGHVESVQSRTNRCAAVSHALQQAQQSSILQASDSYLLALAAAADGSLATQPAAGTAADVASVDAASAATPARSVTALINTPRSARTPSYIPVKNLTDELQQLASGLQQGSTRLQQLLADLPKQLDSSLATARQFHQLAFPPGQSCAPLYSQTHAHAGSSGGDWDAASSAAASVAPSLRSVRSTSSSSGASNSMLAHNYAMPLLRVPEVAEAQAALEVGIKQLGSTMAQLVEKANHSVVRMMHNKGQATVERNVMHLFYTKPQELQAIAAKLQAEVDALNVAHELEHGEAAVQHQSWA